MAADAVKTIERFTDAERVLLALEEARERTLTLIAKLDEDELERVHSPIMSPLAWDLGHIAAYEDLWIAHRHGGRPLLRPELADLYDAFETPRAMRGEIEALGAAESRDYLLAVRARTIEVLTRRGAGDGVICEMVVRHELQHGETMRQTMAIAGLLPAREPTLGPQPGTDGWIEMPAGEFAMGAPAEGFAYDNERPRHVVELASFDIAAAAGEQRELDALQRGRRLRAARVVVRRGLGVEAGARHHAPSGDRERPPGGGRLPRLLVRGRRVRACTGRAPAQRGRVGEGRRRALRAGRAHRRRVRWRAWVRCGSGRAPASTGTRASARYPYREYSEVFFGDRYRVLRGGSWATHPRVATLTFRNWDLPLRRQIFSGLRLARDA